VSYDSEVLADSPRGYWILGADPNDSSGHGHHGTTNGTITYGVGGPTTDGAGAADFDGSTGYVTVPSHADLDLADGPMTVECWLKPPVTISSTRAAVDKWLGGYNMRLNSSRAMQVVKAATSVIATATTVCGSDVWSHVVWRKNGATVTQVLNLIDVTGAVTNATLADTGDQLIIGAERGPTSFFLGAIGRVALYASYLSDARLQAHYDAAFVSGTDTFTYHPFNPGPV
jgi:hypothetical protein